VVEVSPLPQPGPGEVRIRVIAASASFTDVMVRKGIIDYRTEDFVERVKAATGGEGVYAVFDAIGVDNFARSYSVLRKEGLLVEYGLYLKTRDENSIFGLVGEFLSWKLQQLRWEWFPEQDRRFTFYSIADMRTEQPQWFKEDLASLFQLALDGKIVLSVSADPGLDKP
jgi:NADPH:quinone reductase-like Zn-dependent oxidoreductase